MVKRCLFCDKDFEAWENSKGFVKYCSKECRYKATIKNRVLTICRYCGKIFIILESRKKAGQYKFCSIECRNKYMEKKVERQCLICNKLFKAQPHLLRKERAKYCSKNCLNIAMSKRMQGENHPNWKGGCNDNYPISIWTSSLRNKIRKRDKDKCKICGKKQRGLDVHHIDEDKFNCKEENLLTLCRKCHTNIHFRNIQFIKGGILYATQQKNCSFDTGT